MNSNLVVEPGNIIEHSLEYWNTRIEYLPGFINKKKFGVDSIWIEDHRLSIAGFLPECLIAVGISP